MLSLVFSGKGLPIQLVDLPCAFERKGSNENVCWICAQKAVIVISEAARLVPTIPFHCIIEYLSQGTWLLDATTVEPYQPT